jgi:acetyl-CoA carboxylase carboxyl transferase subunit alpha
MKITASDLAAFGLVDQVIPEPPGGAQTDPEAQFQALDAVIEAQLRELTALPPEALMTARYDKFRRMGHLGGEFIETT